VEEHWSKRQPLPKQTDTVTIPSNSGSNPHHPSPPFLKTPEPALPPSFPPHLPARVVRAHVLQWQLQRPVQAEQGKPHLTLLHPDAPAPARASSARARAVAAAAAPGPGRTGPPCTASARCAARPAPPARQATPPPPPGATWVCGCVSEWVGGCVSRQARASRNRLCALCCALSTTSISGDASSATWGHVGAPDRGQGQCVQTVSGCCLRHRLLSPAVSANSTTTSTSGDASSAA